MLYVTSGLGSSQGFYNGHDVSSQSDSLLYRQRTLEAGKPYVSRCKPRVRNLLLRAVLVEALFENAEVVEERITLRCQRMKVKGVMTSKTKRGSSFNASISRSVTYPTRQLKSCKTVNIARGKSTKAAIPW